LKLRKINYVCTASSVLTAKINIKQITIHAHSEDTDSTKNDMQKNIKSFIKIEANQSA